MNELMKEFENSVRLLALEMAKEGAKLVVKRLDEKRERVADAAWVCMDVGILHPHHFINDSLLTSRRIIEAAEAIKSRVSSEAPAKRKLLGVINIEGYGECGQRVKVEGIPYFDDCGPFALDLENEFVKRSAKAYGITSLCDASFSYGPDIYQ